MFQNLIILIIICAQCKKQFLLFFSICKWHSIFKHTNKQKTLIFLPLLQLASNHIQDIASAYEMKVQSLEFEITEKDQNYQHQDVQCSHYYGSGCLLCFKHCIKNISSPLITQKCRLSFVLQFNCRTIYST